MYFEVEAIPTGLSSRKMCVLLCVQLCCARDTIQPVIPSWKIQDLHNANSGQSTNTSLPYLNSPGLDREEETNSTKSKICKLLVNEEHRILDLPFGYNDFNEDSIQPVSITKKNEIDLYLRIFEQCDKAKLTHFNISIRAMDRRMKTATPITLISKNFMVYDVSHSNRWIHYRNKMGGSEIQCVCPPDPTIFYPPDSQSHDVVPPDYLSILELFDSFIKTEHPQENSVFVNILHKTFFSSGEIPLPESPLSFLDTCFYIIEYVGTESSDQIQSTLLRISKILSSHCPECSLNISNFQDINRMSLLHHCSIAGYLKLTKQLISLDASVNLLDSDLNSPLHYACEGGFKNLAQLLIQNGSDVNQNNIFEESPVLLALKDKRYALKDIIMMDKTHKRPPKPRDSKKGTLKKEDSNKKLKIPTILSHEIESGKKKMSISKSSDQVLGMVPEVPSDDITLSRNKKHSISSDNLKRILPLHLRKRAPSDPQKLGDNHLSNRIKLATPTSIPTPKSDTASLGRWESILRSAGMKSNELLSNDEVVNSITENVKPFVSTPSNNVDTTNSDSKKSKNRLLKPNNPFNLYKIVSKVREGPLNDVYIGESLNRRQHVFMNAFHVHSLNPDVLKTEIEYMNLTKDSDHILKYMDSFLHNYKAWVITEYISGYPLSDIFRLMNVPFVESLIAFLCKEILLGLKEIHSQDIVYRNLQPLNIFVCKDGRIKLSDFSHAQINPSSLEKGRVFKPTDFDFRMDFWSLGSLTYSLANGKLSEDSSTVLYIKNRLGSLDEPSKWTPLFHDFVLQCVEDSEFGSADDDDLPVNLVQKYEFMMQHPFIQSAWDSGDAMKYFETSISPSAEVFYPWCQRM